MSQRVMCTVLIEYRLQWRLVYGTRRHTSRAVNTSHRGCLMTVKVIDRWRAGARRRTPLDPWATLRGLCDATEASNLLMCLAVNGIWKVRIGSLGITGRGGV